MTNTQDHEFKEHEPVNVVFNYVVLEKDDEAFKTLMREAMATVKHFKGFRGKHFFYTTANGKINYYIMMQFDTLSSLKNWEESSIRKTFVEKLSQFIESKEPVRHYLTGLESWFALETNKPIIPPPRYKIAILTWVAAYCLLIIIFSVIGPYLNHLSMPTRVFIVSLIMVAMLTYVIMPLVTRLLKHWLYPKMK